MSFTLPAISGTKASGHGNVPGGLKGLKSWGISRETKGESVLDRTKARTKELEVQLHSKPNRVNLLKDNASYRAEKELNLQHFRELMNIFRASEKDGKGCLSIDEFKEAFGMILGQGLNEEQMSHLFMKIDANIDDSVDWDEFSTFMLLQAEGHNKMKEEAETQLFDTEVRRSALLTPHKDAIVRILFLKKSSRYVTCSREGTICHWGDRLKLQRSFSNVGFVPIEGLEESSMKSAQKAKKGNKIPRNTEVRWTHDCTYMDNLNKIALASDDHHVTIYDFMTMETQLRLDLQDTVALSLDYWSDSDNPDASDGTMYIGTDSGYVLVFTFNINLIDQYATQKHQGKTVLLDSLGKNNKFSCILTKRKAHNDWTVMVRYYHDIHLIVSCSPDPTHSLVVATQVSKKKWIYHSAPVHKGVNTFAYSKFPLTLVTGGTGKHLSSKRAPEMKRIGDKLRLWNPHRLKNPMAALKGHNAPIISITINELSGQIISLDFDKVVKIWDIRKQQCLQTLFDSVLHRPEDTIATVFFNSSGGGCLIAASAIMSVYNLKERRTAVTSPKSHDHPIRGVIYSANYKQVVSGCDGGIVNVWDITTGANVFRFSATSGKAEITAMSFDSNGRRLITGARDGTIRMWNYNNGQRLHEFMKLDGGEIAAITYIHLNERPMIAATGWNRRVSLFVDDFESYTLHESETFPDRQQQAWHKDDIVSMEFSPPNLLATASYDGEIILFNVQSGHVLHRLRVPDPWDAETKPNTNRSIDKVLFLLERRHCHGAAELVTCGSDGMIRFWSIEEGQMIWACPGTSEPSEGIFTMSVNSSNTILITADTVGCVSVWDIADTCVDHRLDHSMPLRHRFRAHARSIVSLDFVEEFQVVLTGSPDCTARLFTIQGEWIGTFGQFSPWDINDFQTFQHPARPADVVAVEEEMAYRALQVSLPPIPSLDVPSTYPRSPDGSKDSLSNLLASRQGSGEQCWWFSQSTVQDDNRSQRSSQIASCQRASDSTSAWNA
ncbi:WD40-repeat-containing domain protein [Polychytrium aggregatum]|uniref:WD40-repeat-containing domain protein n=1 Tax=Polychytrium aggregatum TaxID=110093 RepID=UPI0022FE6220|nr:WD40-repeat-containing domain protein [Polychytrium aggregatum]KAI9207639.1 WD40-repeat-containing domain protein [Polychytrium aggregatum]